uniref:Uncharacterized protein n=1 Tax=Arundo donax TaxID=35708 RepID=A0A0A9HQH2_ARUDO
MNSGEAAPWDLRRAVQAEAVGWSPETRREAKAARAAKWWPESAREDIRVVKSGAVGGKGRERKRRRTSSGRSARE